MTSKKENRKEELRDSLKGLLKWGSGLIICPKCGNGLRNFHGGGTHGCTECENCSSWINVSCRVYQSHGDSYEITIEVDAH